MVATNFEKLQDALLEPLIYPRNLKYFNGLECRTSFEGELQRRSAELFRAESSNPPTLRVPAAELVEVNNYEEGQTESSWGIPPG